MSMQSQCTACFGMHKSREEADYASLVLCSDMEVLLSSVSPELVQEVSEDFFANNQRTILYDSGRLRVMDTKLGGKQYRQVQSLAATCMPQAPYIMADRMT